MREGYEVAPPAAELSVADRAMLDFAVKLTREPRAMTREDVEILRAAGFSDTGIHDIVQITGLFAYYNRLADGLGIELEGLGNLVR
jgi:uncharacterized peroxidase-related enzyme